MKLFTTDHTLSPSKTSPLLVNSPLGNLLFSCEVNKNNLTQSNSLEICTFQNEGHFSSWVNEFYEIEFLRMVFLPSIPNGMQVEPSILVTWRIKALSEINCKFKCSLDSNLLGFPEPGENLTSISFENSLIKLTIGTEDEEGLESRAKSKNWLPNHFEKEINVDNIEYLPNGVELKLPTLHNNDFAQIHFIVSWSSKVNNETSTWYAVDQSPKKILNELGFT